MQQPPGDAGGLASFFFCECAAAFSNSRKSVHCLCTDTIKSADKWEAATGKHNWNNAVYGRHDLPTVYSLIAWQVGDLHPVDTIQLPHQVSIHFGKRNASQLVTTLFMLPYVHREPQLTVDQSSVHSGRR